MLMLLLGDGNNSQPVYTYIYMWEEKSTHVLWF